MKKYYKKHAKRKPREQLVKAISFCVNKENKNALDLGSGTFIESKFLAKKDFNVIAIDSSKEIVFFAQNLSKKIIFKNIPFEEYKFPLNKFDIVNAQFALPFYGKKNFNTFIKNIKNSLKIGGIFVGQFFGESDSWNDGRKEIAFQNKKQAIKILSNMKIIEFIEEEKDGETASGKPKHWHIFHFIVKK